MSKALSCEGKSGSFDLSFKERTLYLYPFTRRPCINDYWLLFVNKQLLAVLDLLKLLGKEC